MGLQWPGQQGLRYPKLLKPIAQRMVEDGIKPSQLIEATHPGELLLFGLLNQAVLYV